MATTTKPIALNESLNTTENTPRNIADVLADELDGIKQAINQSGSGNGHIIQNSAGANMPSENTMQFVDAHLSDDSVGGKTKVENIKSVTEAQFETATEDGLYDVDIQGAEIEPASDEYVEVTADGVKTYQTLLNELFALVDVSKLNSNSYLTDGSVICRYVNNGNGLYNFIAMSDASGIYSYEVIYRLNGTNSDIYVWRFRYDGSILVTPYASTVAVIGTKLTLYYGNKSAVIDLQTTANRCLMSDGNPISDLECDKTSAGTYTLRATVDAQGNVTYSWV